ncbi:ATP-binding protein [Streptomyces sp. NPDC102279]|uniref:ATP-binding protein n=1 Tax=Streptomyces sp. NPDC102279 TaxID=3366153 RepID=UPI003823A26C
MTRSRLSGWSVCEDTCDTAALVVSELVTNAIVHAAGQRVVCELHDADDLVRIAVCDEGCAPGEPRPSPERPDEEHGRGLLLVAAVSRAWGAQDTGPGLLVWAELARSAGRAHSIADGDVEAVPEPADHVSLDDLDRLEAAFEAGSTPAAPPAGPRTTRRDGTGPDHAFADHARPEDGPPEADTRPRADLGWSAKKPPNDGRGTGAEGAEGSWRTGTVGVPRDPSAHSRNQDRDRDRDRDRRSL